VSPTARRRLSGADAALAGAGGSGDHAVFLVELLPAVPADLYPA